jgi:hypothetical protein
MNRRKLEERRRPATEGAAKLANRLVLEDAGRVIATWNDRQAQRMPMLFAPTIGAALSARHHFLWVHCRACRAVRDIDLRMLNCDRNSAVTCLTSELLCGSCGSKMIFPPELLRLSKTSIADDVRKANTRRSVE